MVGAPSSLNSAASSSHSFHVELLCTLMLVIEEPTIYDGVAPSGTFVVIALDPVASTLLLDDEAKREAAEIAPTRCLALVNGTVNSEWVAGMKRLTPVFVLVGKGLPRQPESWAAVPLAPAGPHPETGRKPVTAVPALPWPDCYIHTLTGIPSLVSRLYQHRVVGPALRPQDYQNVVHAVMEDDYRWAVEQNARIAQEFQANPPSSAAVSSPSPWSELLQTEDALSAPLSERWLGLPVESTVPELKLTFEMWIDTSSLDELADPESVVREVRRLQQIERDWAHRVATARLPQRPDPKAWLEGIGDADIPSFDPEVCSDTSIKPELDDLVRPEDALEHRIGRDSVKPPVADVRSTDSPSVTSSSASSRQDERASPSRPFFVSILRSLFSSVHSVLRFFRPFAWRTLVRKLFS